MTLADAHPARLLSPDEYSTAAIRLWAARLTALEPEAREWVTGELYAQMLRRALAEGSELDVARIRASGFIADVRARMNAGRPPDTLHSPSD